MSSHLSLKMAQAIDATTDSIKLQMESRTFRAANELRSTALQVLRGQRNGRRYKVPGTYRKQRDKATGKTKSGRYYTASAPGEPPAVRTGAFRLSWQPTARVVFGHYVARIESDLRTANGQHTLGEILEKGTSRMAPRPYQNAILQKSVPKIMKIYNEPYV